MRNKKLTIKDIVEILNKEGYRINRRTFWFYIEKGIIPKPVTAKGKKGVQGFYSNGILEPLRKILAWRDEGIALSELKNMLLNDIQKRGKSIYEKYKFDEIRHFYHLNLQCLYDEDIEGKPWGERLKGHDLFEVNRKMYTKKINDKAEQTLWYSDIEREIYVIQELHIYTLAALDMQMKMINAKNILIEKVKDILKNYLPHGEIKKVIDPLQEEVKNMKKRYEEENQYLLQIEQAEKELEQKM